MAYNTVLIRRRLTGAAGAPALSGGELAFNEVDSTLYYGASGGGEGNTIAIGGNGAFVDRTTSQTIGGDKTFSSLTTLSSTTFSADSVLDFGGNVLTNLAGPLLSSDAATRDYVDVAISSLGSSGGSALNSLSAEVYNTFVKLTDDREVNLTGGLIVNETEVTGNASVGGNLTVTGNLSVLGTQTVINTQTINISGTSTQIDVVNNGTGTGITVNQTGAQDVAEFKDDGATALIIKDGGNVGIGTATPNEKLTVVGNVAATGDIFAVNADFTGTLNVDGATTLNNTLDVTGASTFASTVSAHGALTVDGTSTFNDDVDVLDKVTVRTSNYVTGMSGGGIILDSANKKITVDDGSGCLISELTPSGIGSVASSYGFTISTVADNGAGIKLNPASGSHTNIQQGNLVGTGSTELVDFIIDGGTF